MARVIAICNQKGGVGKTTTAMNLGVYLAAMGRQVLLIDFDPQANATSGLGVIPTKLDRSIYHGIFNLVEPEELIKNTNIFSFHLIPASFDLAGALVELVNQENREFFLRKFLNKIRHCYDYVLIDLPPSLGLLTINGLIASDEILIPVQCHYYSLEGLGQLFTTIDLIRDNLKHPLKITGLLLTMYDKRERLSREVAKEVRRHFPAKVFDVEIPHNVVLAEAPSFAKTVLQYAPHSQGARAYQRLAREVMAQEQNQPSLVNFGNFLG